MKKTISSSRLFVSMLLLAAALSFVIPQPALAATSKKVTVSLTAKAKTKTVTLAKGQKLRIKAKSGATAVGYTKLNIKYLAGKSLVSINRIGLLTAQKAGTCRLSLRSKAGKKAILKVVIKKPASQTVSKKAGSSSSTTASASYVWLSATGSKYHRINNCGRMNPARATRVSLSSAVAQGYDACSKCF